MLKTSADFALFRPVQFRESRPMPRTVVAKGWKCSHGQTVAWLLVDNDFGPCDMPCACNRARVSPTMRGIVNPVTGSTDVVALRAWKESRERKLA